MAFGQTWLQKSKEDEVMDAYLYIRVHPEARNVGIEDAIMEWGFERTREKAREAGLPGRVRSGTRDHDTHLRSLFERYEMAPVRYFFTMIRDLSEPIDEPKFPEGFTLSHSTAEPADVERWVDCFNMSFIDHWNHHPRLRRAMPTGLPAPTTSPSTT